MGLDVWGADKPRRFMGVDYWRQPLKWNRAAEKAGERRRVFCSSMADVFEAHKDLHEPRQRLWELIEQTPWLDWMLLTKRPDNFHMLPSAWHREPRPNVWLGVTAENQEWANKRLPWLVGTPAAVRFISAEPLLGLVDLSPWLWEEDALSRVYPDIGQRLIGKLHLVIAGGESGPGARPMHPDWPRTLRDQCNAAGVAFHFKQWGAWAPLPEPFRYSPAIGSGNREYNIALRKFAKSHGSSLVIRAGRPDGWQKCAVEQGEALINGDWAMGCVGKKEAGRLLDGREWNEMPTPQPATGGALSKESR